ncbi:MAG: recombinase family protein [Lachnospiraceae bacterium]|jgi:DNA invertase Pin-like site-specific DNA recombinase|nr:recombinase family protein [Lachnospiraceae bacterium]
MPRVRKATLESKSVVWNIALYIRLSKEDWRDDDRADNQKRARGRLADNTTDVSRSIVEQRKMLEEYVETHFQEEYTVVDVYMDDGLTGTDDSRDSFQRMMEDVEGGKVNCIIVKTLSRAFRNYADQGRYLEQIFPRKGVRFISISNPFVDSYENPDAIQNGMEIPINGLMNDRYAAKTSADVRRTFDAKRRRGEFIGAFAPYGYHKDPDNKGHLIIDDEVADVVRNIFLWFVNDGLSKASIAKKLNGLGICCPSTYKAHVQRLNYKNPSLAKSDGLWSGSIVLGVLTNEVYIGNMVQGRSRIISYKVHTQRRVPQDEWYIVPNTHDAIIDKETFDKAQLLHSRDTRTAPNKRTVYLFSGFLRCADCKRSLRRRMCKDYVYYHCRTKVDKGYCTDHAIREDKLIQAVLSAIQVQIATVESLTDILDEINQNPAVKTSSTRLNSLLATREEELHKMLTAIDSLYLDWKSGEISKDDYHRMKGNFDEKCNRLKEAIEAIKGEINNMSNGVNADDAYLTAFTKHKNITSLDRGIVTQLIDTIYLHEDGKLTIKFAFADELKRVADFIENNRQGLTVIA